MDILKGLYRRRSFLYKFAIPIVAVATAGLIFELIYLIHQSRDGYYALTTSNIFLYVMCFISYYKCIVTKHALPSHLPAPRRKHQLKHNHPMYTEINHCDKQNRKYKPPRTSHCKTDGCVTRFDHHCPYIDNCVGYKNLKVFFLFVGYGGFFALQFLVLSIYNYIIMSSTGVNPLSQGQVVGWMLLTLCSFILSISMVGFFFGSLYFLSRNITKIDMMKGQFLTNDKEGTHPNPFDLGSLTNISTVFQGQLWTFWWPSQMIAKYDGTKFPMVPLISNQDKKQLYQKVQDMLRDPFQKQIPSTIQQLFQKQKNNHKHTLFFFLGEQYRIKQKAELQKEIQEMSDSLSSKKSSKQASEIQQEQKILQGVYDD